MKAIRMYQDVSQDGTVQLRVPKSFGRRVEVIVFPVPVGAGVVHEQADPFEWDADEADETIARFNNGADSVEEWREAGEDEVWR